MTEYNTIQSIGDLANTYLAPYVHHLHDLNQFAHAGFEAIKHNSVTMYLNDLYHKSLIITGGDIHPDGKKLIVGAAIILILAGLGIWAFNYSPGTGAGDNSLHSSHEKKHGRHMKDKP